MLNAEQQFQAASHRLREAVARSQQLASHEASNPSALPSAVLEALAYNLERAAWAMLDLAQAWVFEQRLGIPRKETESFDLLFVHGAIEQDRARRYKQLSEFRSLSSREASRVDWEYLKSGLSAELELFLEWDQLVSERKPVAS